MKKRPQVVIVGAGHTGLIAACYLARAGREILVLEQAAAAGGGSRTEERLPGYRFDTHAVAHDILTLADIPEELDLAGVGLEYSEMNSFSVALRADGRRVHFDRSIEATVASIAEIDREEANAYAAFMDVALSILRTILPSIRGEGAVTEVPSRIGNGMKVLRHGFIDTVHDLLSPYESLLNCWLKSDLTRGPVSAFAAQAHVGPTLPGGALFAFWQKRHSTSLVNGTPKEAPSLSSMPCSVASIPTLAVFAAWHPSPVSTPREGRFAPSSLKLASRLRQRQR